MITLYSYWRSGAAHRVRIALELKGLAYAVTPIDLAAKAHRGADYLHLNPQGFVPALQLDGGLLIQSPAIIEWLDEVFPDPPLLPPDPEGKAHCRALAAIVGCDIHPLGNARVLNAIRANGGDEAAVANWAKRWIKEGFDALEPLMAGAVGPWAMGADPSLADCFIAPQIYAALSRYQFDMSPYPRLAALNQAAEAHSAFIAAHPTRQPDAPAAQPA
jgi:maleylpyruvate isomerase